MLSGEEELQLFEVSSPLIFRAAATNSDMKHCSSAHVSGASSVSAAFVFVVAHGAVYPN